MPPVETKQRLVSLFSEQSCWMIEPLSTSMAYSMPSVRRFLAEVGYFSSFSHNGKWYTLSDIPKFNRDGIWFFDAIGFSRTGSLTHTIIHLIDRSPEGLTAEQIGQKLRCRCHSILVQLVRSGKLQRCKLGRSHVYLSMDPEILALQRQLLDQRQRSSVPLPAEIAVLVLVKAIRHPESSFDQLGEAIRRSHGVTIQATQIEGLFKQHGLKKMLPTGVPDSSTH